MAPVPVAQKLSPTALGTDASVHPQTVHLLGARQDRGSNYHPRQGTSTGPGPNIPLCSGGCCSHAGDHLLPLRGTLCGWKSCCRKQPLLPWWEMWLPRSPPLPFKARLGPGQLTSFHPRAGRRGKTDLQLQGNTATCPHQRRSPPTMLPISCNPDKVMCMRKTGPLGKLPCQQ